MTTGNGLLQPKKGLASLSVETTCACLIFQMKTSYICEICNATSIISYIFSPQIRLKFATQAPSSIVFLMRRPKGFINEQHNWAKT